MASNNEFDTRKDPADAEDSEETFLPGQRHPHDTRRHHRPGENEPNPLEAQIAVNFGQLVPEDDVKEEPAAIGEDWRPVELRSDFKEKLSNDKEKGSK